LGRPGGGATDRCFSRWTVRRSGRLLWIDGLLSSDATCRTGRCALSTRKWSRLEQKCIRRQVVRLLLILFHGLGPEGRCRSQGRSTLGGEHAAKILDAL